MREDDLTHSDMATVGLYAPWSIALSVPIAIIASYAALDLAERRRQRQLPCDPTRRQIPNSHRDGTWSHRGDKTSQRRPKPHTGWTRSSLETTPPVPRTTSVPGIH